MPQVLSYFWILGPNLQMYRYSSDITWANHEKQDHRKGLYRGALQCYKGEYDNMKGRMGWGLSWGGEMEYNIEGERQRRNKHHYKCLKYP